MASLAILESIIFDSIQDGYSAAKPESSPRVVISTVPDYDRLVRCVFTPHLKDHGSKWEENTRLLDEIITKSIMA